MDLRFTEEEVAFRAEVRAFVRASLPSRVRQKMIAGSSLGKDDVVQWQRILNKRGWATPAWPKAHGGPGWTAVQRYIFLDELHQAPAPEPLSFNVNMIGPVLYTFGTEEQKRRFLPRIANLDDWWCQGFSEPGAGSDLASLATSARRIESAAGDHYVVNGQKTWQGMGHHADWMFTLVRTAASEKPQAGISMLLIDMKTPGVTVRPIITIDGRHEVNEVFLDDVRVPVEQRVGAENAGWDITKFLLGNERTGIARIGMSKHLVRRAKSLAATLTDGETTLADNPRFREQAAAIEIELRALEITQMRVLDSMKESSDKPDPRSSILKVKGTELRQRASELLLDVAGPLAAPFRDDFDDGDEPLAGSTAASAVAATYFNLRAASIYGGSNEIQKNILAKGVLGL